MSLQLAARIDGADSSLTPVCTWNVRCSDHSNTKKGRIVDVRVQRVKEVVLPVLTAQGVTRKTVGAPVLPVICKLID